MYHKYNFAFRFRSVQGPICGLREGKNLRYPRPLWNSTSWKDKLMMLLKVHLYWFSSSYQDPYWLYCWWEGRLKLTMFFLESHLLKNILPKSIHKTRGICIRYTYFWVDISTVMKLKIFFTLSLYSLTKALSNPFKTYCFE